MKYRPGARRALSPVHLALMAALALGLTAWRTALPDPLSEAVEARLLDLRFRLRGPRPSPEEVVIVAIDEESLFIAPSAAARRHLLAEGFRRIAAAGPAVVATDLLLLEETGADAELAAAMADVPRLVMAAAATEAEGEGARLSPEQTAALEASLMPFVRRGDAPSPVPAGGRLLLPLPRFAGIARLGHVNILRAPDRVARRVPLVLVLSEEAALPALPLVAAATAKGVGRPVFVAGQGVRLDAQLVEGDSRGRITLDHYGPAGTIRTFGLSGLAAGHVPGEELAGRIVLVGSTAESLRDRFATPFGSDVSGVEVLATAAANLVRGETIRRDAGTALATAALAVAAGLGAMLAGALRSKLLAGLVLIGAAALAGAVLQAAMGLGRLWLDAVAVGASLAAGGIAGGALRYRAEQARQAVLSAERRNLAHYVSPVLAEALAAGAPLFDRRRQDASVLFVDVAGYTTLAETADPVEVADFLKRLHRMFEDVAEEHGGVVVDFAGDGAMIVFGLPSPRPDDAARALECARVLAGPCTLPGDALTLELRVSLHHGPIAAAILGGERQGHVSVTGDTVNVASRLQDSAKAVGAALVTTRETLEAAGLDRAAPEGFAPLGAETVRGRRRPIEVYRAVDATPQTDGQHKAAP